MYAVWSQVKVKNEKHSRAGQAGVVHAVDPEAPEKVAVKFDVDQEVVQVKVADLLLLSAG